jgi:hypothetical protein
MVQVIFAVYCPPSPGLPHLAVCLTDKEVVAAEPVQSVEVGEQLLQQLAKQLSESATDQNENPPSAAGCDASRERC